MKNFFQCVSSFLLPSSDLFCRWFESASKGGKEVDKKTDRSYSDVVWLEGVFHLQSTLTANYRIYFHSSHFCRISTFEFLSRREYVTLKKKKYNRQWMCSTPRGGEGRGTLRSCQFSGQQSSQGPFFPHWSGYSCKGWGGGLSPPSIIKNYTTLTYSIMFNSGSSYIIQYPPPETTSRGWEEMQAHRVFSGYPAS